MIIQLEDLEGHRLMLELDQRTDHLAVCVATLGNQGDYIASRWFHLTAAQAREIADAIYSRWGGPLEDLY